MVKALRCLRDGPRGAESSTDQTFPTRSVDGRALVFPSSLDLCRLQRPTVIEPNQKDNSRSIERLQDLKAQRRNTLAEDWAHQWHVWPCMITTPASSRWSWFSGGASGGLATGITPGKTPPSKCGNDGEHQVTDNEPKQRHKTPAETGHVADMNPEERQPSNQNNPRVQRISCKGNARLSPRE